MFYDFQYLFAARTDHECIILLFRGQVLRQSEESCSFNLLLHVEIFYISQHVASIKKNDRSSILNAQCLSLINTVQELYLKNMLMTSTCIKDLFYLILNLVGMKLQNIDTVSVAR